jgi:hypothetical protein
MPRGQKKATLRHSKVQATSLRALARIRPLLETLRHTDPVLADQLLRAATHVASEIFTAERWPIRSKREHLLAGLASTNEALALLRLAIDSGQCSWGAAKPGYLQLSRTYLELSKCVAPKTRSGRVYRTGS